MKNKQLTITYSENRIDLLNDLRQLKNDYQINISAYCADAIRQKLLADKRIRRQ